jgi:hypothetical protein
MCDRNRQVNEFATFFINNLNHRPGHPQICFVRGEERECHDSLIERLIYTQIKPFAEKKFGEQNGLVVSKKLGWPYDGELAELQQELMRMLFADFYPLYMEEDLSSRALSDLASSSLSPFIVIQHRIHAARWNKMTRALLDWYFKFWAEMAPTSSGPHFLIFFNIIYSRTQMSRWWEVWLRFQRFDKNRIERELSESSMAHNLGLPCLLLRELLPLKRDEVEDWFSLNNIYSEKVRYELLEKMFRTEDGQAADYKNMADIEHELQRLIESIQQNFMRGRGYV